MCPSRRTSPLCQCLETLSFIRLSERRNVVLPEPVGPISAVMAPLGMSALMPAITVAEPKPRDRSRACMAAGRLSNSTNTWAVVAVVGKAEEVG